MTGSSCEYSERGYSEEATSKLTDEEQETSGLLEAKGLRWKH